MASNVCREVDKERLRQRKECDRLREINEEQQVRLVNFCHCLYISITALHIDWLGEKRMIEIDVQSSAKS